MEIRTGDIVLMLQKSKNTTEWRSGVVTHVHPDGSFSHMGHFVAGYLETGQGRCNPAVIGKHPYGFCCALQVIGHLPNQYFR